MSSEQTEPQDERRAEGMAESIYGTLLVMTVVVGVAVSPHAGLLKGAAAVVLTALVFWLAHVYAHALQRRYELRRRLRSDELRRLAGGQWPLVTSGLPPAAALVVCAVLDVKTATGFWVALWVGVGSLFLWGVRWTRQEGGSVPAMVAAGSINVLFGLLVVVLKLLVQH
jgi:hypothetical protein